ncbi:hypothetical protein B5X24_HaOG211577 [Helicoverpa armigera]|nr:hypothetical protein B5X24_HaOG211577 [Helicoverpa armigera]
MIIYSFVLLLEMRVRTHAHRRESPPQRAAIRRARRPAPRALRPHAIALHSGSLRCVRKKRTQEARGGGAHKLAATGRLPPTQSLPDARKSTPPPHAGRSRHFSTRAKQPRPCYELC